MPLDLTLADLARLDNIRNVLAQNDPRQQFARLDLRELVISGQVIELLNEVVARNFARRAGRLGQPRRCA